MIRRLENTDPRIDDAAALLVDYPKGISRPEFVRLAKLSPWTGREVLRAGRDAGRLACIHPGHGQAVWTTAAHGKKLAVEVREEARRANAARQKARREALKNNAPPAKLYEQDDFDPYAVRDLPVRQVVVTTWAPLTAPVVNSIFNWASHA